ncbi:hypothetical protein UPYG_G00243420 [Umbra pygmaea]|uniref:Uncharacterized protein n=1 Tax=Umbra pygmaea TaxID=75934 RepID=A0ABD0WZZ8_UMBPY
MEPARTWRSSFSLWTWQTATLLSRDCDIVDRSQVFKRRRALKLRSASQEDTGTTSNSLTRASTCFIGSRSKDEAFIENFKLQQDILPQYKAKDGGAFVEMVKKASCSRS